MSDHSQPTRSVCVQMHIHVELMCTTAEKSTHYSPSSRNPLFQSCVVFSVALRLGLTAPGADISEADREVAGMFRGVSTGNFLALKFQAILQHLCARREARSPETREAY